MAKQHRWCDEASTVVLLDVHSDCSAARSVFEMLLQFYLLVLELLASTSWKLERWAGHTRERGPCRAEHDLKQASGGKRRERVMADLLVFAKEADASVVFPIRAAHEGMNRMMMKWPPVDSSSSVWTIALHDYFSHYMAVACSCVRLWSLP
jgi:hypothetical protein